MLYVYIACLTFGVLYAIVASFLGSEGFDDGSMDGHDGGDAADVPSPFNPLVIASAIAAFGAVGIIGKMGLGMGDMPSSLLALTFAGIVGAAMFFGVVKLMYSSQSNSTFSLSSMEGADAQVITPIPEKGMGEIALAVNGVRYNFSARSYENKAIGRGETVRIKEMSGNTAIVTHKISIDDIENIDVMAESDKKDKENNIRGTDL